LKEILQPYSRPLDATILVGNEIVDDDSLSLSSLGLKNGSIIRGMIIEQVPNQSIKIQTKDRNVFVFKYDEIEKMTKENLPADNSNNKSQVIDFKKSGFINLTEINWPFRS
jgi:hypothetical protein